MRCLLGKNKKESASLLPLLRQAPKESPKQYLPGMHKKTAAF